jgi:L-iditol 2-dehydrogenase
MKNKSLVLEKNQVLKIRDYHLKSPGANECTIKIKAVGLCSSDVARSFDNGAYFYPLVMGHEISGVVETVGADSREQFMPGDRVTVFPILPCFKCLPCKKRQYAQCEDYSYYGSRKDGGYAHYLNVTSWNLMKIPDGVSFNDAALTEPTAVVLHALSRAKIENVQGKKVAIIGAGFLGLLASELCTILYPNCNVTLVDRNDYKLKQARNGVDTLLLGNHESRENYLKEEHSKFDYILEAAGVPSTFTFSLKLVANGGTVIWMGNISDDLKLDKQIVSNILRKEINLFGTWNSEYKTNEDCDWQKTLKLMKNGLCPSNYVDHFIGISEVGETLQNINLHKKRLKKIDLTKALVLPDNQ